MSINIILFPNGAADKANIEARRYLNGYLKAKDYFAIGGQIVVSSIVSVLTEYNDRD